ncbi:hypothetical protein GH714_015933 [Hevea brasiliensis]|uniref:Uncharacterized protein n=1 Tax=Hevea brasiliensis TaxID=3981 RepID=A0A6A6LXQ7_HEVBR|nr:hypothetical protein GH714_015933 [Hevea brasiliensis]
MNVVEERHSTIVVEEVYQNPPQQRNGVAQGFVINHDPSAPPLPPPPMSVVSTNAYVNSGEHVTGFAGLWWGGFFVASLGTLGQLFYFARKWIPVRDLDILAAPFL